MSQNYNNNNNNVSANNGNNKPNNNTKMIKKKKKKRKKKMKMLKMKIDKDNKNNKRKNEDHEDIKDVEDKEEYSSFSSSNSSKNIDSSIANQMHYHSLRAIKQNHEATIKEKDKIWCKLSDYSSKIDKIPKIWIQASSSLNDDDRHQQQNISCYGPVIGDPYVIQMRSKNEENEERINKKDLKHSFLPSTVKCHLSETSSTLSSTSSSSDIDHQLYCCLCFDSNYHQDHYRGFHSEDQSDLKNSSQNLFG